mgnify:CR=1 FL=1
MIKKFLAFLRKVNLHWFVAFFVLAFVSYIRLFGFWGPAVTLALLLLLRRQIGKLDLYA